MNEQLILCRGAHRERFRLERFFGTDHILVIVKQGSFSMKCQDVELTVRANEGAVFRKDILYDRRVIEPVDLYLFRFQAPDGLIFASDHIVFRDRVRLASTLAMLEQLDTGICKDDFEIRNHLFRDLLTQYTLENEIPQHHDQRIAEAIRRIQHHLHEKIDLADVGAKSGLSYVQFLRRFKAATGISPSDYVAALRMQKAKEMLSNTPRTIKEIADVCGFSNEYYFSNFFKKQTGLSPSAFRASLS
ncbi:MAG: helix-turn-helix transcriptional regulator [Clostridia bacterium]|nr:helix-turn-helix transcriptional regulator [Clostridia bacterium]